MDVSTAIRTRRAVKQFDANHEMSQEELDELLGLAMLSPTAFNIQNWRFVVVRDPELRRKIRAVSWDQAQVTDASVLIVLCADTRSWEKEPARYWKNAAAEVRDFMVSSIDQYYRGRDQVQRDEAMRSCGIAAQTLMLAAKELGYDAVADLIRLPEDHVIAMFVAIGRGTQEARPRGGQLPVEMVSVTDRF